MERPTAEAVGRGAGYVAAANVITSLIAFAFYAAAARILGPRGMGEVTMLFLVIGLYGAVGLLGANAAAARFAAYHSGSGSAGRATSAIVRSMELAAAGRGSSYWGSWPGSPQTRGARSRGPSRDWLCSATSPRSRSSPRLSAGSPR